MDKRKYIIIVAMIAIMLLIILLIRRAKQKRRERQDHLAVKQLVAETNADIEHDRASSLKAEVARKVVESLQGSIQGEYGISVEEVQEVKYPKAIVLFTKGDKTVTAVIENHQISLTGEKLDIETEQTKSINIKTTLNELNQKLFSIFESIK